VKAAIAIAAAAIALRVICVLPEAKSFIRRQNAGSRQSHAAVRRLTAPDLRLNRTRSVPRAGK
jgi:hypothetical protein